uniref:Uncharacterized protein n=1 Tax=Stomoxys calcitrans TaxID=35570 RepID=A0A1I8Q090_STOCA
MEDTTQTSKPLKAAKQTKTQSQPNNRRSAEAAPPPSTTHNNTVKSGAAYRTAAAAYADNNEDVDDDNSSNIINNNSNKMGKSNNNYMNRNNNNTNTVRQNNSTHSMPHYNGEHWQRGGQAEKESSINKLPMKLMNEVNEDQMDNEFSKLSNDEKDIEELQRSLHKEKILKENNFEQNQNEQPAMRHNDKLSVSLEPKQLQYNSSNDDDCCWDSASSHNIHVNTLLTFRPHTQQVMGKRQRFNHQQRRESSSHTQCQHLTGEKTPSMLSSQTQRIPSLHGLTEMPSEPSNGKFGELYRNNKSINKTAYDTARKSNPSSLKELQKLKPKPAMPTNPQKFFKKETTNLTPRSQQQTASLTQEGSYNLNEAQHLHPNMHFEDMIRQRNQFLKSCEKNPQYNNPNFSEPWKVVSIISEKLLDEVLETVATDFDACISKFVEDFLELETKIH